jgi:hypothetical protein
VYFRAYILAVLACALLSFTVGAEPAGQIRIRVENRTGLNLKRIKVSFLRDTHLYGDLRNGALSHYYTPSKAHGHAYAEAYTKHRKIVCRPIDFVGAQLLEPGDYTYVLTYHPEWARTSQLHLELRHD